MRYLRLRGAVLFQMALLVGMVSAQRRALMTKAIRTSFGMGIISRALVLGLIAASIFAAYPKAAMAAPPGVSYCTPDSQATDLTLFVGDLGVGVPLPEHFWNGTEHKVTFTTTMKANRFFGPERVVWQITVDPGMDVHVFHLFVGVDETTPLGTDTVVVEATSDATGETVLARCTFNLTVTRRPEQRDVIGIPLRLCFLEGTLRASGLKPGQLAPPQDVVRLIDQINNQTWLKHARITFRAAASSGVPVIEDPDKGEIYGIKTEPGEVLVGGANPGKELDKVKKACELRWQGIDPSQKGIPVVFIDEFVDIDSTPPVRNWFLGAVPEPERRLIQFRSQDILPPNGSTPLCQHPRQLLVGDVTNVGVVLLSEKNEYQAATLAHELGHTLLLGHGNGLDDDSNGKLPPEPGPRRFDEYCDTRNVDPEGTPLEDYLTPSGTGCEKSSSLMHVYYNCPNLRPLQVEQARAAAKLVPGAVFDSSADPAGALISDLADPSLKEVPADVLIASVEMAETPGLVITEIAQTVVGSLPGAAHNRYTTVVDLDNDPTTGCNPADLGLPTAFGGAELVTSVVLRATEGQPPQLTPTVWRCEAGELVPLPPFAIEARASDAVLEPAGAWLFGRIEVLIPSGLIGPHSDIVRVQAFAEQLGAEGKMSRVPVSPDAGGLIFLSAPSLPRCSVRAPVVNPGSITRVRAEGLPPSKTADVLLGGEPVGTGEVNDSGIVDIELPVQSTSRLGLRPVTVQIRDTLFLATCEVEVVGNAVTPITSVVVTPGPNAAGWNNSDVTVTLAASSAGATVTSLTISATGAQAMPKQTIAGGSAVVPISAEGETILSYFAADSSGRIEPPARLVIRIDKTPPSIFGESTPNCNPAGWNSSAVTVNFHCEDVLSGVASCSDPVLLTAEGVNQFVTGTVTDRAGNTASVTVGGINIDKTSPTMTCTVSPKRLWPPNHELVTVTASVVMKESLSGGAGFILTSVTSNESDSGLGDGDRPHDIQGFDIGTPDTRGRLRAEHSGKGSGRVYTLTYQGVDVAGNTATCLTRVSVSPTQELHPSDDAWVNRGEAGNDGTGNHLKVQKDRKDAYVKFDLHKVRDSVSSATLTLTTSQEDKKGTVHVHRVINNSWEEGTINGKNAPAIGPRLDSATASGVAGEKLSWDVTPFVRDAVSKGAHYVSFALVMTDGYQVYFSSKENKGGREAPVLTIK